MLQLLVTLALLLLASIANACDTDLECQIVEHRAKNAVSARELALEIEQVAASLDIDPKLLAAMVLHESRGVERAYNPTGDHGLTQINTRTAIDFGISVKCLYNWRCNLRKGAELFAKNRPCLYNLGRYRVLTGKFVDMCHTYEAKLYALVD